MGQRFVYLAFDNIKKCFYKKTTLISIIGLAFILGYSAATFMIEESSLKVQFSSNDYVIYFFNDFIISGIFLGVLFIISLVGMFWGNGINYMWISRLSGFKDVFRLFALSIFLWVICYMTFVVCLVFMVGGIIKEYSSHWSSGAVEVTLQKEFLRIDTIYSPTQTIIVSIWMVTMLLLIIGFLFYIGYCFTKGIGLGIFINFIVFGISAVVYLFDLSWVYKGIPNINALFTLHSHKIPNYPTLEYSFFFILGIITVLLVTSCVLSKKYLRIEI